MQVEIFCLPSLKIIEPNCTVISSKFIDFVKLNFLQGLGLLPSKHGACDVLQNILSDELLLCCVLPFAC